MSARFEPTWTELDPCRSTFVNTGMPTCGQNRSQLGLNPVGYGTCRPESAEFCRPTCGRNFETHKQSRCEAEKHRRSTSEHPEHPSECPTMLNLLSEHLGKNIWAGSFALSRRFQAKIRTESETNFCSEDHNKEHAPMTTGVGSTRVIREGELRASPEHQRFSASRRGHNDEAASSSLCAAGSCQTCFNFDGPLEGTRIMTHGTTTARQQATALAMAVSSPVARRRALACASCAPVPKAGAPYICEGKRRLELRPTRRSDRDPEDFATSYRCGNRNGKAEGPTMSR